MEAGEGTLYDFKAYAFKAPVGINPDKSRLLNAWYSLSNFLLLLYNLLLLLIYTTQKKLRVKHICAYKYKLMS